MRKRTRKHRPQIKELICLKSLLPCYSEAKLDPHFKKRVRERGFDLNLIPSMWSSLNWRPGDFGRWLVELPIVHQDVLWSLTVDFGEDDQPVFITVCDRSLSALAKQLPSFDPREVAGSTTMGGAR